MPRRTAEPLQAAAEPLQTPEQCLRVRTTAQNDEDAQVLCARGQDSAAGARRALTNQKGSKAAVKSGLFGEATHNMVEPLLRKLRASGKSSDDRDHHRKFSPTPSASSRRCGPCTQPVFLGTQTGIFKYPTPCGGPTTAVGYDVADDRRCNLTLNPNPCPPLCPLAVLLRTPTP